MRNMNFNREAAADLIRFAREEPELSRRPVLNSTSFALRTRWELTNGEYLRGVPAMFFEISYFRSTYPGIIEEIMAVEGVGEGTYRGKGRKLLMTGAEIQNAALENCTKNYAAEIDYAPPIMEEVLI